MRRPIKSLLVGVLLTTGLSYARATHAHGTAIEVTQAAVEIKARFDTGEPMADAQVLVYAPGTPETPWKKGQTDAEGTYLFSPAAEMPGDWEVTVRKAGHGGTTTFLVNSAGESTGATGQAAGAAPPTQKWLSMAAMVWGFIGTALFFSRKTSGAQPAPAAASQAVNRAASDPMPDSMPDSMSGPMPDPISVGSASGGQP